MTIPPVFLDLLKTPGPSGHETAVAEVWRTAAREFAEVTSDTHGNSFARVKGTGGGPTLAVFGHIDEIGLLVSWIDDDGLLSFKGIGGWDPIILVGQRVELHTRDGNVVPGVVGKKPIHLLKPEEREKAPKGSELHIDIGAKDGDAARELVRVGDWAVIAGDPVELAGGRWASRAMDNRVGAFVALEAARLVAEAGGAAGDVIAVASVQEEEGLYGATTAAFGLEPTCAIAVDVTFANQPGVDVKQEGKHELGSGAVINTGVTMHPLMTRALEDAATAAELPVTWGTSTRRTGTDADAVHVTRGAIPTGLVSVPLRYMHSPVETVAVEDVLTAAKVIAGAAQQLSADTDFTR